METSTYEFASNFLFRTLPILVAILLFAIRTGKELGNVLATLKNTACLNGKQEERLDLIEKDLVAIKALLSVKIKGDP